MTGFVCLAGLNGPARADTGVKEAVAAPSVNDGNGAYAHAPNPGRKGQYLYSCGKTKPVIAASYAAMPAADASSALNDETEGVRLAVNADSYDVTSAASNPSNAAFRVCSNEEEPIGADAVATASLAEAAEPVNIDSVLAGDSTPLTENSVPVVMNRSVEAFIRYFQTRGRKHFVKWLSRSPDYMSMLQSIMRENGLPEDISYIAFIESGLNPKAKSRAKAVGMWQFIKGTAKKFGLRVDWWIDERMDPEKATLAAAKYLKNLYGEFGSWYLAAAGYNAGEGRVRSALRKHRTGDFWELASHKRPLKRETREYVPKYIAAMLIAKNPPAYGFEEFEYAGGGEAAYAYDKVSVCGPTDLRVIAEAAGASAEEIQRLNPELLRWFTPPNYPEYEVKIPRGSKEQFAENFSKIPTGERLTFQMHTVKRGDTLSKIAKLYKTDTKAIQYINNMKGKKQLRVGSTIAIPVRPYAGAQKKVKTATGGVDKSV
ncbi:MAG: transglycosylase SLT domain-containing protein [Deltaproteobacteria bacterium]|nr:transglycosylase SLT domain-containing protein [Deltaproteobacteria bacterium]